MKNLVNFEWNVAFSLLAGFDLAQVEAVMDVIQVKSSGRTD